MLFFRLQTKQTKLKLKFENCDNTVFLEKCVCVCVCVYTVYSILEKKKSERLKALYIHRPDCYTKMVDLSFVWLWL